MQPMPVSPPQHIQGRVPRNGTAHLLNFLLPGVGHAYGGFVTRSIVWAAGTMGFMYLWAAMGPLVGAALGYRVWVVVLVSSLLAVRIAPIVDYARLKPSGFSRPGLAGSLAGAVIVGTLVGNVVLRVFFVEAFKTPSGAMIPTLVVGDHVFVNKTVRSPHRGDLVVFRYPEKPEQSFVKRVLGLPGDVMAYDAQGHPSINGWRVPSCPLGATTYEESGFDYGGSPRQHKGRLDVEYLDGHAYLAFYDLDQASPSMLGPWTVRPDEFWVSGDNRNNSHDSRFWFGGVGGGVPYENLQGRVFTIWLSIPEGIDWSRFGQDVDAPVLPKQMATPELQEKLAACLTSAPRREDTAPPPAR